LPTGRHDLRYAVDCARSNTTWLARRQFRDRPRQTVDWFIANRRWWERSGRRYGVSGWARRDPHAVTGSTASLPPALAERAAHAPNQRSPRRPLDLERPAGVARGAAT
jgi:hypothetical protein